MGIMSMFEKREEPPKIKTPQKNQAPQVTETPGRNQAPKDTLVSVESLLDRAYIFLGDEDFPKAGEYFDRVLKANPECAKGYMGRFLASRKMHSAEDFIPFFMSRYPEEIEEILQTKPPHLRKTIPAATIEIDSGIRAAAVSLPDDWKSHWLYFDLIYVPIADAMEEAYKTIKRDILDDSNFKRALNFAEDEEKQKYQGYFDSIDKEVEKIKATESDKDSVLLRQSYERYLSEVVPLLREMRSFGRFSVAEIARFSGAAIYVGWTTLQAFSHKYTWRSWRLLEFLVNLAASVILGAIVCIPVFVICWIIHRLTSGAERKRNDQLSAIRVELREYASSIENIKALSFVFPKQSILEAIIWFLKQHLNGLAK
jgi:hypothetical protein